MSSGNDYYFQWGPRRNNRKSKTAAIWEAAVFGYWWVGLRQHLILSIEPHSKVIYLHPPFDQVGASDQDHPHVRLGVGHWLCKWTLLTPIWHELPKVEKFWISALMQTTFKTVTFQSLFRVGSWLPHTTSILRRLTSHQRVEPLLIRLLLRNQSLWVVQPVVHLRVGGHGDSNVEHDHILPWQPWPWLCSEAESVAEKSKLWLWVERSAELSHSTIWRFHFKNSWCL